MLDAFIFNFLSFKSFFFFFAIKHFIFYVCTRWFSSKVKLRLVTIFEQMMFPV